MKDLSVKKIGKQSYLLLEDIREQTPWPIKPV